MNGQARVLTIPNVVSFARLAAVPYFWFVLLVEERHAWAGALVLIIGTTDWVDGYLARRLDQVSQLGKVLDPLADRLMIASALIGGLIASTIPAVIGWPLLAREALVSAGALWLAGRGGGALEVRYQGKVATFLLYGAIPSFYLSSGGVLEWLFQPIAWITGVLGLLLYWYVGWQYGSDIVRRLPPVESPQPEEELDAGS